MIYLLGHKSLFGKEFLNVAKAAHIPVLISATEESMLSKEQCIETVKKHGIKTVILCMDYISPENVDSELDITRKYLIEIPALVATICREHAITCIYISNEFVFDGLKYEGYTELDTCNPQTTYGNILLEGEGAIRHTCSNHLIIRTSWLYGRFVQNYVYTLLNLFLQKSTITIADDQTGGPTNCKDLCVALLQVLQRNNIPYGTYHFSNHGRSDWYEYTTTIFNLATLYKILPRSLRSSVNIYPISTESDDNTLQPKHSYLISSKFSRMFSIEIRSWKEALEEFISQLKPVQRK